LRGFLLTAGLCVGVAAPCNAEPAITTAPAAMRRAPNAHSHIVQTVPANAQIDLENCSAGWCGASWRNLFGYISAFAVAEAGSPTIAAPPPFVVAVPPVVAPAFQWSGPYVGGGFGYGWGRW
jgi:hypothetical protein